MFNVLPLISTACAFFAVYLVTRSALVTFNEAATGGRELERGLDYIRKSERLPSLFRLQEVSTFLLPLVKYLVRSNRLGMREHASELDHTLVRAGLRPFIPPEAFLSLCFLTVMVCGLMMASGALLLGFGVTGSVFGFISGGIAGYALPHVLLSQLVTERVSLIEKRLPFAIEFMLLTMEANAAFPVAVEIYCMQFEDDPLAEELRMTLSDIDRGVSTSAAFANMGARVVSEHLSAFVLAITIGIETGQPIKDILETQATAARQKRYESAEVVAKKASTSATFPLFIIVLAILLLLLGPIVINMTRSTLL